jgi:hypothetical protein
MAPGWGQMIQLAADKNKSPHLPQRSHVYTTGMQNITKSIPCQLCGGTMGASAHTAGYPVSPAPMTQRSDDGSLVMHDAGTGAGPKEGYGEITLIRHKFQALPGQDTQDADYKMCALCGYAQDDEVHAYSEPDEAGGGDSEPDFVKVKRFTGPTGGATVKASVPNPVAGSQKAFMAQLNGKTIIAGPASVFTDPEGLPRELAAAWERQTAQNPHFQWIEGRFVEADRANRNMALWSSNDLASGEGSVTHGPLNWLHEERHIVGTIAAAKLVEPRQVAGEEPAHSHIRALAAVWGYIYPLESRQIARASDDGKLWYSMECISREVACAEQGCSHTQTYAQYMQQPHTRCGHVKNGGARQFRDPSFLGGAVILPPVRPGWHGANASVLRQASMLAENQEDAFTGLSASEAELLVAQVITYSKGTAL